MTMLLDSNIIIYAAQPEHADLRDLLQRNRRRFPRSALSRSWIPPDLRE